MKKILFSCSMLLGITSYSQVPSYVPTNGLIGYWPLSGNANDASGNNLDGVVTGASLSVDRFGISNSAYHFDGNNDIKVVVPQEFSPIASAKSTWSFWFKRDNTFQNQLMIEYKAGTDPLENVSNYDLFAVHQQCSANTFAASAYPFSSFASCAPTKTDTGNWYHIVAVFNQEDNIVTIYKNSAYWYTYDIGDDTPEAGVLVFGNNISSAFGFYGTLDDIAIWNRELAVEEIKDLYEANICFQTITVTDTLIINTGFVGLNPVRYENQIKIYPNPTNDHITIDNGNFDRLKNYQLKITNSTGQIMFSSTINQAKFTLDLTTWSGNGIYFVHLIDETNNTIDIRKIVLQ